MWTSLLGTAIDIKARHSEEYEARSYILDLPLVAIYHVYQVLFKYNYVNNDINIKEHACRSSAKSENIST